MTWKNKTHTETLSNLAILHPGSGTSILAIDIGGSKVKMLVSAFGGGYKIWGMDIDQLPTEH